jgi:hypothetical protein
MRGEISGSWSNAVRAKKKEDATTSPRPGEEGSGRLSEHGGRVSRRSFSSTSPSPSPGRKDVLSPRDDGQECRVSVALPSGAVVMLRLPKVCKVDQVKAKVFATADELAGLAKDDFVLACSGRRFKVEFQRLTRAEPMLDAVVESGGVVELQLLPVDGAAAAAAAGGGTPALARRRLGPAVGKEPAFSTPQAPRKTLSPRPAGGPATPSPVRRDAGLRERELEVQRKRERLESERRAADYVRQAAEAAAAREAEAAAEAQRAAERAAAAAAAAERVETERRAVEERRREVAAQEEVLRQKREALEQKQREREAEASAEESGQRSARRRHDEEQAAARLRVLEVRQRELDEMAASRDEEQRAAVAQQRQAEEEAQQARRVAAREAARVAEEGVAEARLHELEQRQRHRDTLAQPGDSAAAESSTEDVRHAVAEEEARMEVERRQRERDRLLLQQRGTPSPDTPDDTGEEARLQSLRELVRKKQEVEEKRAELERKMREVEERQRRIERKRNDRLEQERDAAEQERRQFENDALTAERRRREAAGQPQLPSPQPSDYAQQAQQQRDAELLAQDTGDSLWEMLREKQMAEEAKRKQLSVERSRFEEERAERERHEKKLLEDENSHHKKRVAEAAEELQRWKSEQEDRKRLAAAAAEEERRVRSDNERLAVSMPVLSVTPFASEEDLPPPPLPTAAKPDSRTSSPAAGRKKHQRTGSFGFLHRASDKEKNNVMGGSERVSSASPATPGPEAKRLMAAGGPEKKGTPLLSRISQGVKGVRSVLVQRRTSFRSAKPLGQRSDLSTGPDDFPAPDEIADEDDLAILALSHEAVRRCAEDAERAERARSNLRDLAGFLVAGKCKTTRTEYCGDNKFYWIESTYSDFDSEVCNPDNLSLLMPHLDDTVYADRIRQLLHKNYFAIDEKVGPIVLTHSLVADENGDFCHILWSDTGLREFKVAAALYNQLPAPGDIKQRLRLVQKVLETHFSVSPATRLTLAVRESFAEELDSMEHSLHSSNYKFGVLYAKEGQNQNEMFGNREPSPAFERFLELLGDRVELQGFAGFRGGLDVKHGHTGSQSVYTKCTVSGGSRKIDCDIMFHVSTMLPYSESDAQQLERKRHLGNDIVVIVFLEGEGAVPYDPNILKSEFNHAFVIVQPVSGGGGATELYRVHCIYKSGVPECNPFLPGPETLFGHGPDFRAWLLAKCINAERASCQCVTFSQKLRRTRRLQTQMLVNSVLEESEKANKS